MKKLIFGIFAHPDDEAFGPSGYFLQQVKNGAELHLITLTLGDAGANPDGHTDLAAVREQEWRRGGAIMGAKTMNFLGYRDGKLDNNVLIEAGKTIQAFVATQLAQCPQETEVEFVTSDLNGISGHIDHIVAARAAAWAFYRHRQTDPRVTRLLFSCVTREDLPESNVDWLYMEPGRSADQINFTVDARAERETIVAIMRAHHTQRGDGETHIKTRGDSLGLYSFIAHS